MLKIRYRDADCPFCHEGMQWGHYIFVAGFGMDGCVRALVIDRSMWKALPPRFRDESFVPIPLFYITYGIRRLMCKLINFNTYTYIVIEHLIT